MTLLVECFEKLVEVVRKREVANRFLVIYYCADGEEEPCFSFEDEIQARAYLARANTPPIGFENRAGHYGYEPIQTYI